nr:DUF4214 domain-containing protein [uncultured Halomonas sp.]
MATQADLNFVQQLYVAYYGRPAEQAGLTYWADRAEAEGQSTIINAFGQSEEFDTDFGDLDNADLINNLYQQLFGRDAEQAGRDFYAGLLDNDEKSLAEIAVVIKDGAQGTDKTAFDAKVQAAEAYTARAGDNNYDADSAKEILNGIDGEDTQADLEAALGKVDELPAQSGGAGSSNSLTSGADMLTGTTGDDTFVAAKGTLGALDSIDGKEGIDTLRVEDATELNSGAEISNVETIEVIGAGSATLDVSEIAEGIETLNFTRVSDGAGSNFNISGLNANQTVRVAQRDTNKDGGFNNAATVNAEVAEGTTANIEAAGANIAYDATKATANTAANLKTVNVTSSGEKASTVAFTTSANFANVQNVSVNGTGDLALTVGDLGSSLTKAADGVAAATIDASAATGDVELEVATGAKVSSVKLGSGDDILTSELDLSNTKLTLDGGEGNDTLFANATQLGALQTVGGAKISNFETLGIDALAASFDASSLSQLGFESLALNAAATGASVTGLSADSNVTLTGGSTVELVLADAEGKSDSLSFSIADANTYNVTADGVETLNVTTVDKEADGGTFGVSELVLSTADAVETVNLSGEEAVLFDASGLTTLKNVDASGITSDSDASASTPEYAANIIVDSAATVTGSAGADSITFGDGAKVTGGAGDDTFVVDSTSATKIASITDFQKGDVIVFGAAVSKVSQVEVATTPGAEATFTDYVNSVSDGEAGYFNFADSTYLVYGNSTADNIVELGGNVDLTGLQINEDNTNFVEIA